MTRTTECVVVELTGEVASAIEALWAELERDHRLHRAHPTAPPHLTLAVVFVDDDADRAALRDVVRSLATRWRPFVVKGAGYGVFVGDKQSPVLHIALTKTPELAELHAQLTGAIAAAGLEVDGQSLPEHWRPHVNLADRAITGDAVGSAIAHLVDRVPRHWTLRIDNLTGLAHRERPVLRVAFSGQ